MYKILRTAKYKWIFLSRSDVISSVNNKKKESKENYRVIIEWK